MKLQTGLLLRGRHTKKEFMPVSVSSLKVNTEEKAMSTVMLGTEVAKTMKEELIRDVELLKGKGIHPCLAIIRVGAQRR